MALFNELEKIGLSEKEAKVYLANLELGQSSVQAIAKKSGINRATAYVVLDSLIDRGLASTYQSGKKTFYISSNPEFLMGTFELQKKEIEEKQKIFNKILPQIKTINNLQEDRPVVTFFEGKEGLLAGISEFLTQYKKGDEKVRMMYPLDLLKDIFTEEERERYRKIRKGRKIKSKTLYNSKKIDLKSTEDGTRLKINDKDFPISCDIGIYGDNVRIASLGKRLSAVFIKDKEIASSLKSLFDLAWEGAKAREKKVKKK